MEQFGAVFQNLAYCGLGGLMLIAFAWLNAKLFNLNIGLKIKDELQQGNVAVGLAVLGIFVGTGMGLGLVIGLSLH